MLYTVLNEEPNSYWVNPIEQWTRGFNKKILSQLNEVTTSLFGFKGIMRTVKYEKGVGTFQPVTEHKVEPYHKAFWIDIIECPRDLRDLSGKEAQMKFDRLMMDHTLVQAKREFMEDMGRVYIIHYDYHVIFDIIKRSN